MESPAKTDGSRRSGCGPVGNVGGIQTRRVRKAKNHTDIGKDNLNTLYVHVRKRHCRQIDSNSLFYRYFSAWFALDSLSTMPTLSPVWQSTGHLIANSEVICRQCRQAGFTISENRCGRCSSVTWLSVPAFRLGLGVLFLLGRQKIDELSD